MEQKYLYNLNNRFSQNEMFEIASAFIEERQAKNEDWEIEEYYFFDDEGFCEMEDYIGVSLYKVNEEGEEEYVTSRYITREGLTEEGFDIDTLKCA